MDILGFIFMIWIFYKIATSKSTSLETILRTRNFSNIRAVPIPGKSNRVFLTAQYNSMKYLFVRNFSNSPISYLSHEELQSVQTISKQLNCDRVIFYIYQDSIPIEFTKVAALYNVELWNKIGESNFSSYRATKANTTNSRLAKTLKPETTPFEHRPNGVIAKDTCHIAPSTSPIQENPTSLFKRKGPQRL